jgi:two-component system, cell cycle response regulator DivK
MKTILLVEDNESNANILQDMFEFDGIPAKLVTVTSGEDALRCAAQLQPALILMDLRMPGIDGLEATLFLKMNAQTRDIPIWAITAYAMEGDEERAYAAGCSGYITKPINIKKMAEQLRAFLKECETKEALPGPEHVLS